VPKNQKCGTLAKCSALKEGIVYKSWTLCYRSKLSITLKSMDLATCGFQKFRHTHQNLPKLSHSLQYYVRMLFLLTPGFEHFSHNSTPSDLTGPGFRPAVQAS